MRVLLSQPARAARNHIIARRADEPEAAIRLADLLEGGFRRLGRFPYLGRVGRRPGTRELLLAGTPYMFVYQIADDAIIILDIVLSGRK